MPTEEHRDEINMAKNYYFQHLQINLNSCILKHAFLYKLIIYINIIGVINIY